MHHGRTPSASSTGWTQHSALCNNNGSGSSESPTISPLVSPLHSPYVSPCDSPREQLHSQFARQMSLQPPPVNGQPSKSGTGNTFVHKLYNMVADKQYQHLIAWTYTGTSFIVCNITEFSRDVLPKHFKHNNFSSFVRQLNMYGFHKVNKSPRGHRALAENQIWEFSHPKFIQGRPDLLDEIKRKAVESDMVRRENDLNTPMALMQVAQSDMMQQLAQLQENFSELVRELADTRRRQEAQQRMIKQMVDYLSRQQGAPLQIPPDFDVDIKPDPEQQQPPPIYITSPDAHGNSQNHPVSNAYLGTGREPSLSPSPPSQPHTPPLPSQHLPSRPAIPLSVQTQNLHQSSSHLQLTPSSLQTFDSSQQPSPVSPSQLSPDPLASAINTPLPPSPSPSSFLSDDDATARYSRPHSPNIFNNNNGSSNTNQLLLDNLSFHHQQQQQHLPLEYLDQHGS